MVAYWLFQLLAKGWLESHFQRDLEALKAENLREAERLKADLGRYADRATKFHAREYEVLPEAWGKMNMAFGATYNAILRFQQYADLDTMTDQQLEAWFDGSGLHELQKSEIKYAADKNNVYSKILTWKRINGADKALSDFNNYLILNGIFVDEEVSEKMATAAKSMHSALISREMAERVTGNLNPGGSGFWI